MNQEQRIAAAVAALRAIEEAVTRDTISEANKAKGVPDFKSTGFHRMLKHRIACAVRIYCANETATAIARPATYRSTRT